MKKVGYYVFSSSYFFRRFIRMVKEYYKLATVNSEYCDYLREFDYRVSYNANKKKLRPFVGVLFEIDKIKYFAPLSSP